MAMNCLVIRTKMEKSKENTEQMKKILNKCRNWPNKMETFRKETWSLTKYSAIIDKILKTSLNSIENLHHKFKNKLLNLKKPFLYSNGYWFLKKPHSFETL